ncbi:response regulator [Citrifermentans bremense]|uniref:response regulator n=1 Tax=Citrifermentans bremense TaxID=60035 RepID=UPI00040CDE1C|nr:response regulator [Citrifermentans bremense]
MERAIRILCVDDEKNVLRSLERIFLDDDYTILTASSGQEGLELLHEEEQVHVIISDYRMPGMNGVEFLRAAFDLHPECIRIILSGYADTTAVVAAINEGKIYKFIPKPWNDDELRVTVNKAIEHFEAQRRNLQLAEELRLKNMELREVNAKLERLVEERTLELALQDKALLHARRVLDQLPFGVVGVTGDGIVLQMNREAAQILGILPDEVLGERAATALPAELCAVLQENWGQRGGRDFDMDGKRLRVERLRTTGEAEAGVVLTLVRNQ